MADNRTVVDIRLEELEKLWPMMKDRIYSYDKVLEEFKVMKEDLNDLKSSISNLSNSNENLNNNLKDIVYNNSKISVKTFKSISDCSKSLDSLVEYYDSFKDGLKMSHDTMNQLGSFVYSMKKEFDDHKNISCTNSDFDKLKNLIDNGDKLNKLNINSLSSICNSYSIQLDEIKNNLSLLNSFIEESKNKNNVSEMNISNIRSSIECYKSDITRSLKSQIDNQSTVMMDAFEHFKKEVYPDSMIAFKKEYQKKLDETNMNSDNAIQISRNVLKQINSFEKKLESVLLKVSS